jgi:hypothetical protein
LSLLSSTLIIPMQWEHLTIMSVFHRRSYAPHCFGRRIMDSFPNARTSG